MAQPNLGYLLPFSIWHFLVALCKAFAGASQFARDCEAFANQLNKDHCEAVKHAQAMVQWSYEGGYAAAYQRTVAALRKLRAYAAVSVLVPSVGSTETTDILYLHTRMVAGTLQASLVHIVQTYDIEPIGAVEQGTSFAGTVV